jgi:catechol 2,3-dioxygenase-like lactoylglutathione lyase family enzyme
MPIHLDHTLVHARDSRVSATFLADILGLPAPTRSGPFEVVRTDNGVSLDFIDDAGKIVHQHYAFLLGETEFDEIFGRIRARGLPYWADPARTRPGSIYHSDGGRGVYFPDPDGHLLEILTRPSGGTG